MVFSELVGEGPHSLSHRQTIPPFSFPTNFSLFSYFQRLNKKKILSKVRRQSRKNTIFLFLNKFCKERTGNNFFTISFVMVYKALLFLHSIKEHYNIKNGKIFLWNKYHCRHRKIQKTDPQKKWRIVWKKNYSVWQDVVFECWCFET